MRINILTYNIQHGLDYKLNKYDKIRKINLEKIANVIKNSKADIVGLNEVYNYGKDNIDRCEQTKKLANLANIKNFAFAEAIKVRGTDTYGNAFLSKFDIESIKTIKVPSPDVHTEDVYYEDRVLLKADVNINGKILSCFITHFGLANEEQERMFEVVKKEIEKTNNPYIFMGDFNMTDDSYIIEKIKEMMNITIPNPIPTFNSIEPFKRIDYIFLSKDIKLIESEVINVIASDHLPVKAIIEI